MRVEGFLRTQLFATFTICRAQVFPISSLVHQSPP